MATTLLQPRSHDSAAERGPRRIAITFVIDNLSRAGTETQLIALIRLLDRSRFEPSLILLDGENDLSRSLEPRDCKVVRLGIHKLLSHRAYAAAVRVRDLWRRSPPDVVQAYFLDPAYFSVPLARWCRVPHILRVRNNLGYWLTQKHRLMNTAIRPWVEITLTNSNIGAQELIRQDGVDPRHVVVMENGVDLDRFADLRPPVFTSPVRIGCVANLRPVKNIDGLMRAARSVIERHPQATFLVAGEGEDRFKLERLRMELALGDRFQLLGAIDDVPGFLQTVDIAVLPSHSEGMSNALLEYMAAGRAIIATETGANAQLVEHARHGLIVPPGDDAALVTAIENLISEPTMAFAMAAAAKQRAFAEYSREGMKQRFEKFYSRLVFQAK